MESQNPAPIVLMADNDEDDCLLVKSAFETIGIAHDLRFVGNGRELLDYLHNEGDFSKPEKCPRPDLILLDLNMPLIDGREALTIIKSDPQLKDIPILILTTSKEESDIALSRLTGASSFLAKPAIFEELSEMLSKFCTAIFNNSNIPFQVIGC